MHLYSLPDPSMSCMRRSSPGVQTGTATSPAWHECSQETLLLWCWVEAEPGKEWAYSKTQLPYCVPRGRTRMCKGWSLLPGRHPHSLVPVFFPGGEVGTREFLRVCPCRSPACHRVPSILQRLLAYWGAEGIRGGRGPSRPRRRHIYRFLHWGLVCGGTQRQPY